MPSQNNTNPSEHKDEEPTPLAANTSKPKKESPVPTATVSHSNTAVNFLMKIASAYNNNEVDETARAIALTGFLGSLRSEKEVGQTRAEDKMLAGVMDSLTVDKKGDENDGEGKGNGNGNGKEA